MKQVIVMRNDLNMRKGKMIAQGAHASLGIFTSRLSSYGNPKVRHISLWDQAVDWLDQSFVKICVRVNSEEELMDIVNAADASGIPHMLVTDAGLTEFNGVPTKTCAAIGPWDDDEIDKITGGLMLL